MNAARKLSSLGSRSLAHRKGRSVLTGTGIVLGVAILFGVLVANATTQVGVDRLFEDFTGRADVVASPVGVFDAELPEGAGDRLRALPDVRELSAGYGTPAVLPEERREGEPDEPVRISVNGVVPAEDTKFQNFVFVAGGRFPTASDEVVLSERLATDLGVRSGETVDVRGRERTQALRIVGLLERKGAGRAGQGRVGYTTIDTARALGGDGPATFTGASLILTEGTDVETWLDANQDALDGVRMEDAGNLAAGFREFLRVFGTFLTFFAGITLFVGAFLIYLTLSMAVIERTRMYGTLRALGATKPQVRRIVLLEALVLGAVSTALGLVLGLGLAWGLLRLIAALFELPIEGLVIGAGSVVGAVIVGMLVTALSSLLPAVRAGRLAPVEAMKGDHIRDTRLSRLWIAGAALLVVGVAVQPATAGNESGLGSLAVIGILLGTVLLVPLLLRPLASLLGRVTNRIARGVGEVAVLHLAKERSRSAYTLALVMVVMAMLFATGGLYLSVRGAMDEIVERQFGADMFISSGESDFGPPRPLSEEDASALRSRSDLRAISPVRFGQTSVQRPNGDNDFVFVRVIEPESYFDVAGYFWTDGEDASAQSALAGGGAVLLSDGVARRLDVERGDNVMLRTREGKVAFDVAGVYVSPPGPPEISMGIGDGERYLAAREPVAYIADVTPGADPDAVGASITSALQERIDVETASELKAEVSDQIGSYFRIVYAILLIAAIVGLLGLANTLAMSVLQRFREIGILRAVGVTRGQVWRMVLVESVTLGLVAFVLSIPLGWLLTALVVSTTGDGFGFEMATAYPWSWIPIVALFGLIVAVVAAVAPGRRAARLEVVGALQYE